MESGGMRGRGGGKRGLIANNGSKKIGNGWVEVNDLIEEVKGL